MTNPEPRIHISTPEDQLEKIANILLWRHWPVVVSVFFGAPGGVALTFEASPRRRKGNRWVWSLRNISGAGGKGPAEVRQLLRPKMKQARDLLRTVELPPIDGVDTAIEHRREPWEEAA